MNKNKIFAGLAMTGVVVLTLASFAGAASNGMTASCSGVVTGNNIQWTAGVASGTAPFSYLWSGVSISGNTSNTVTAAYAPGTYTAAISINDASSSVATSTCVATVAQPLPVVTCNGSVSGNSILWTANPSGGNAPYTYLWSGVNIGGGTSSTVSATYANGTYTAGIRVADASSTVATSSCVAAINQPVTPPATSTIKFFKKPDLSINPNGNFIAHGMIVQSISGNSFTGTVWGTTWTINLTSTSTSEFYLRGGNRFGTIDLSQLSVGDEVGVMGQVDPTHPLTVNGRVIRNYTIVNPRQHQKDSEGSGNSDSNENNSGNHGNSGSSTIDMKTKLQGMLQQLQGLQLKFHGNNNGNGNGNGKNKGNN